MTGFRRAAAALFELSKSDQDWMLAALPENDRAMLSTHLEEMRSLGFTNDAIFVDSPSNGTQVNVVPLDRVAAADAQQIYAVLAHEPSTLIAQVLLAERWKWADEFLRMLSPIRQTRIKGIIDNPPSAASARTTFVVSELRAALIDSDKGVLVAAPGGTKEFDAGFMRKSFPSIRRLVPPWRR